MSSIKIAVCCRISGLIMVKEHYDRVEFSWFSYLHVMETRRKIWTFSKLATIISLQFDSCALKHQSSSVAFALDCLLAVFYSFLG